MIINSETKKSWSLIAAMMVVACDFLGTTIQVPVLHEYKDYYDDAGDIPVGASIGILLTIYNVSQFIGTPVFGILSDRFGRKPLLLTSAFGSCIGFFAQAIAPTFVIFCMARFLTGLFAGSRPVCLAYIGDRYPPHLQPSKIATLGLVVAGSNMFAPLIGSAMASIHITGPTYFIAIFSGIIAVFCVWCIIEPSKPKTHGNAGTHSGHATYPKWKCVLLLNAFNGGYFFFIFQGWFTLFTAHATEYLNFSSTDIGIFMATGALLFVFTSYGIVVPLSSKVRLPLLQIIGTLMINFQNGTPFFERSVVWSIISSSGLFMGVAIGMSPCMSILMFFAPPNKRGLCSACQMLAAASARVISPVIVGPLFDIDLMWPYISLAPFALIALAVQLFLVPMVPIIRKDTKENQEQFKHESNISVDAMPSPLNEQPAVDELEQAFKNWRTTTCKSEMGHQPLDIIEVRRLTEQEKGQFVCYMCDLLKINSYPFSLETLKSMCRNLFPEIPNREDLPKAKEAEIILEAHCMFHRFLSNTRAPASSPVFSV